MLQLFLVKFLKNQFFLAIVNDIDNFNFYSPFIFKFIFGEKLKKKQNNSNFKKIRKFF